MTDAAAASRILTLVFTDLADSMALKMQRGDQSAGELIARHRAHTSQLAAQGVGRIIDWAGDGCFLTFESPSAAALFALRLQQVHGQEPDLPGVRVGMHLGEVSERIGRDGDVAQARVEGLAVDLAARIGFKRPSPWIAGLHFARGRVADAIAAADECIAKGDSALDRAQAHLQRARIRLRSDGATARADVEADHTAVLALIDSRGIEGIRPELHESRAELARVLGDDAAALHELREAHRLNAAMGASGHAARLARELGL